MKTRNDILSSLPKVQAVETESWGVCYVRQITGSEFGAFMAILDESTGGERLARLTVLGLCNDKGERLLADGDEIVIMETPLEPQGEVAAAFLELNGVQEQQKKSLAMPSTSPSSLPSSSERAIPAGPFRSFPSES